MLLRQDVPEIYKQEEMHVLYIWDPMRVEGRKHTVGSIVKKKFVKRRRTKIQCTVHCCRGREL